MFLHSHPTSTNRWPRCAGLRAISTRAFAFAFFLLASASAPAGEAKITGLQFTIGQPADQPAARVTIAEVGQGAQKKGFLRIALLPLVQAKGVEVRLQRPDISALSEIQSTLRGIAKLDAQEFQDVRLFLGDQPVPLLLAAEATPTPDGWHLKRASIRRGESMVGVSECVLYLSGPKAGICTDQKGGLDLQLELADAQPAQ